MKIIVSTMLVLSGLLANAQDSKGVLFLTKPLSSSSISSVEAKTSGGDIEVSAVNVSEARIEVYVTENNHRGSYSKEAIEKKIASDYDVSVTVSGNKLTATARPKKVLKNSDNSLNIAYRIFVPAACATQLKTSGGGISITGLSGEQAFKTSGGELLVKGVTGKITGRTSGGEITVTDSKDDIDLQTSGGEIHAANCNGKIKLNSSGGSIQLKELGGDIVATTSGGNVNAQNITGDLDTHTSGGNLTLTGIAGSLNAYTSGGNINVEIAKSSKFVRLKNSGGNISLQIPKGTGLNLDIHGDGIKTEGLSNFSGAMEKKTVNGTVNGGGIPVDVQAGSGEVSLRMR